MHSIPIEVHQSIETVVGKTITDFSFAAGGCINHGGPLSVGEDVYFLKWNDLKKYPKMFEAEAHGLQLLASSKSLKAPAVIATGVTENFQYLILEFIDSAKKKTNYWEEFGRALAHLHKVTSSSFGLDRDNYIGSLDQQNNRTKSWVEFFVQQRLRPQLLKAHENGIADTTSLKKFDLLFQKLESLLISESPALLHGDLWSGNLIEDRSGAPCLIDPAVYFGNREVDLAMTGLFGGFERKYLDAYREVFPLQPGYLQRCEIYNLYPLLVHTNLFGKSYWLQVVSKLNQFV